MSSDHQRLLDTIYYNPETGIAIYRKSSKGYSAGSRVGGIVGGCNDRSSNKPYRYVVMKWLYSGTKPFSHLVNFYMTGRWPEDEMDHVHGNTLDDRWAELRESTRSQNEANRGPRKNNKLGFKGVYAIGDRFRAAFYRRGRRINLGSFETAQDAHAAYLDAVKDYDNEFLRM